MISTSGSDTEDVLSPAPTDNRPEEAGRRGWEAREHGAETAAQPSWRGRAWVGLLYPEEVLAIALVAVTVLVNLVVHRTLNADILFATVNTYRAIFRVHLHEFFRALRYFATAYVAWEFLRFLAGRPVHFLAWRRTGKLRVLLRALPTYFLCGAAFGNLWSFIHLLSPIDRDDWLIAADRALFLGHDPIKLLEPLVTPTGVTVGLRVYLSLYLVPWFAMLVLLADDRVREFRDTLLSWWLALAIGWIGYLLVPAIGPQYTLRHTYVRPVFDVERILEQRGMEYLDRATFPSLHTAFSVTVLILIWRYTTSWSYRIAFTVWVTGIVFTTMYLRFHYVVDVIAGVGLALLCAQLGPRINDWYDGSQRITGAQALAASAQGGQRVPKTSDRPTEGSRTSER